jgi:hypothetical protein
MVLEFNNKFYFKRLQQICLIEHGAIADYKANMVLNFFFNFFFNNNKVYIKNSP